MAATTILFCLFMSSICSISWFLLQPLLRGGTLEYLSGACTPTQTFQLSASEVRLGLRDPSRKVKEGVAKDCGLRALPSESTLQPLTSLHVSGKWYANDRNEFVGPCYGDVPSSRSDGLRQRALLTIPPQPRV